MKHFLWNCPVKSPCFLELIIKIKTFYKSEEEFSDFYVMLKLILCPHCQTRGYLILHGFLYGYSETDSNRIRRGHRIFCSNRNNRTGCGKTFSVLKSTFIKNFVISANTLWCFLDMVSKDNNLSSAFKDSGSAMQATSFYRIFTKFRYNQVRIRTKLTSIKDPPLLESLKDAAIQTIVHLKSIFQHHPCPVSQFQNHFQTSFL